MNIPTYEESKISDKEGVISDVWRSILIQLLQQLGNGIGKEGFQVSQVTSTQMTTIQNAQDINGNYTCQYGTLVFNLTTNALMCCVNNGSNVPLFKTVTLT